MTLNFVVLLLDVLLMSLTASSTLNLINFSSIILCALKVRISTVVHFFDVDTTPSELLNALLLPILTPRDDICPICYDDFESPHELSCNHVFCRDCITYTLAKWNTCPICQQIPTPQNEVGTADPMRYLINSRKQYIGAWLRLNLYWSVAWSIEWIASSMTQLHAPPSSEVMLAAVRASIEFALQPVLADVFRSTTLGDEQPVLAYALAMNISHAWTLAVTLTSHFGTLVYFTLIVASIVRKVRDALEASS